jgi:hypothetical protein
VRLYAHDLWIEARPVVDEVNAGCGGLVTQRKSGMRGVCGRSNRAAIQSHREQDRCQKWYGYDCTPNGWARSLEHR